MFRKSYGDVFDGDDDWRALDVPTGDRFAWDADSTYVRKPPYFDGMPREPAPVTDIDGARVLAHARRHRHDRPHLAGRRDREGQPRRRATCTSTASRPSDFNSYGARRGNHEVMVRGTFANIRLRNLLAPGTEGGVTPHLPDGEQMSIYDAAMRYAQEGVAAGRARRQGVRLRLVARLGGEGHDACSASAP